jgi:hypothetical protein
MIVGQVELLLARIDPANPLYADLQAIAKVARQGVALIRQLLAFAGREAVQPEVLDVNASIQELKPKLRRILGGGVKLQLALSPQLKPVYADARVLQDIWLNLSARAAASMPQGGALRVDTAGVTLTAADVRIRPLARVGDYVRITLTHSGAALSEEALQGIFELQLASAEAAVGNELGLGVVYGLVHQLGGFMEVARTADGKTEWAVYLPAYPAQGAAEEPGAVTTEQAGAVTAEAAAVPERPAAPEPPEPVSAAPQPAPAEPESGATEERPVSTAAEASAIAQPVPEVGTSDMPQPAADGSGEQVSAVPAEAPPAQEAAVTEPTAGEAAASEPVPQVPAWLVEATAQEDITESASEPADASAGTPGDITDAEPPPSPSGLSGLGSRLRQRLGRGRAKGSG